MNRENLIRIIEDLRSGRVPELDFDMVPSFSPEALEGKENVRPGDLRVVAESLTENDIPTFERAVRAIDEQDLAWIGFKIPFDPEMAVQNTDNEVTKKYGDQGSADGMPLVFFCNDAKEIVASRELSPRDKFQAKDVTRGPSMHNDQFDGLTWLSVPLFDQVRVWLLGASDASSEVSKLAAHVGFRVIALDYDPAYLNEQRFPDAERILMGNGCYDDLFNITPSPDDYVCVLTRGHMFDPEGCIWAKRHNVHYVGMMGCKGKNTTVHDLVTGAGITEEQWESIKRPIGLKFGAKTPAELAIAIVAELIDVRYKQRYSEAARDKHEQSLGRA